MRTFRRGALLGLAVVVAGAVAISGCGSSKPKYCSDRTALQTSVKDLGNINLLSGGGLSDLQSQLKKIQTNAGDLHSSAKSDFPKESKAVQSSVTQLTSTVKGFPSSPTPSQVAALATETKSVVSNMKGFVSATASKCS